MYRIAPPPPIQIWQLVGPTVNQSVAACRWQSQPTGSRQISPLCRGSVNMNCVCVRVCVLTHFAPSVSVAPSVTAVNGLISAPISSEVTMTCHVEASPKPIYYWATPNGENWQGSDRAKQLL